MASPSPTQSQERGGWWPVWDFGVHVGVGTLIFGIIAGAAVGLDLIIQWLQSSFKLGPVIVYGLMAVEYVLFVGDLILFLIFILAVGVRAAQRFWRGQ